MKLDQSTINVLEALACPSSRELICLLGRRGELCVGEIVEAWGRSQPQTSATLAILRAGGLVAARRERSRVYYSVNRDAVVAPLWQFVQAAGLAPVSKAKAG